MPTLTIDGQEVEVPQGTTLLQAAQKLGIDIPTFCYHPGLSIAANCRMCLVETDKSPKPVPACHAQVMDGMQVTTQDDRVKKLREAVLEFILLNHPVDCPICDQSGECVLQDHYSRYSTQTSRLFHRKVHKDKARVLGPDVMLDAERCILCTRCVRFCDEIARSSQLEVTNRGDHSEITTFPGRQLDNPYAGNVVDICPVGALTSRSFRFKTRVWFLQSAQSVCPECSRGCRIRVDVSENAARRLKPQHNPKVNDWWMCDEGRRSLALWSAARVEAPAAMVDGRRRPVRTDAAVDAAVEALSEAQGQIAVVATPWLTNEDALVLAELVAGPLRGAAVYLGGAPAGEGDEILRQPDKNPNTRGVTAIFEALGVAWAPLGELQAGSNKVALVFGDRHPAELPAALAGFEQRVVCASLASPLAEAATVLLPARIPIEKDGSFTNFAGVVQRISRAVHASPMCKSEAWWAMEIARGLGLEMTYRSPAEIFESLATRVPGFAGMSHQLLDPHGLALGEAATPAATRTDSDSGAA